jgi:hypothetical protein
MMMAICEKLGTSGRAVEVTKGASVDVGVAVSVDTTVGVGEGVGVEIAGRAKQAEVKKEARTVIHKSLVNNVISVSFENYLSIIRAQANVLKSQFTRRSFCGGSGDKIIP